MDRRRARPRSGIHAFCFHISIVIEEMSDISIPSFMLACVGQLRGGRVSMTPDSTPDVISQSAVIWRNIHTVYTVQYPSLLAISVLTASRPHSALCSVSPLLFVVGVRAVQQSPCQLFCFFTSSVSSTARKPPAFLYMLITHPPPHPRLSRTASTNALSLEAARTIVNSSVFPDKIFCPAAFFSVQLCWHGTELVCFGPSPLGSTPFWRAVQTPRALFSCMVTF